MSTEERGRGPYNRRLGLVSYALTYLPEGQVGAPAKRSQRIVRLFTFREWREKARGGNDFVFPVAAVRKVKEGYEASVGHDHFKDNWGRIGGAQDGWRWLASLGTFPTVEAAEARLTEVLGPLADAQRDLDTVRRMNRESHGVYSD